MYKIKIAFLNELRRLLEVVKLDFSSVIFIILFLVVFFYVLAPIPAIIVKRVGSDFSSFSGSSKLVYCLLIKYLFTHVRYLK